MSFKSKLVIPVAHIVSVSRQEPVVSWKDIRAPGSFIPGLIKAGTYYSSRGKEFWVTVREKTPVTLELKNEKYQRVILGVDNVEALLEMLKSTGVKEV